MNVVPSDDLTRLSGFSFGMPDFINWFLAKSKDADCVVALARAAPRLLQYYSLVGRIGCPVISERTIPFLPPNYFDGKSVLLFDDTIGFGSTMDAIRRRLVAGGARVECAAIAVDQEAFLGERTGAVPLRPSKYLSDLNPDFLMKASAHQLDVLHGLEIRAFRKIGKPYMFDFPIYEASLRPSIREKTPGYIAKLFGETDDNPFLWSPQGGPSSRIYHFGIPISRDYLASVFPEHAELLDWQPFSKLRVFIDYANLKLRFVPLAQLDSKPKNILDDSKPLPDDFLKLLIQALQHQTIRDNAWQISVHRALVYSISCQLATIVWHALVFPALHAELIDDTPSLSRSDALFFLGRQLADQISQLQTTLFSKSLSMKWQFSPEVDEQVIPRVGEPPKECFSNPRLWEAISENIRRNGDAKPSKDRDAYENISYLIPILHEEIDIKQRDSRDIERLWRGFSYADLLTIVNSYGAKASRVQLSTALDEQIDSGILVPQVVVDQEKGVVRRVYRSGEVFQSDGTLVLKSTVYALLKEREANKLPPLSEKAFSKTFVILKKLFPDTLPFRLGPQTYGLEPFVNNDLLRNWCQRHRIIELSGDGRQLITAVDLPVKFPERPVEHSAQLEMRLAFDFLAELDGLPSTDEPGSVPGLKMLLLLSTCNNHQTTFNACAWEVHSWFRQLNYNFDLFLSQLESVKWSELTDRALTRMRSRPGANQLGLFGTDDVQSSLKKARAEVLAKYAPRINLPSLLQQCRSYLIEYRAKNDLFHKEFAQAVGAIAKHFSTDRHKKMFWEEKFQKPDFLDDRKLPQFTNLFKIMDPLEDAAWRLMDITSAVLVANQSWDLHGKQLSDAEEQAAIDHAVEAYNAAVEHIHSLGIEFGRLHKFEMRSPFIKDEIQEWISHCRNRFVELKKAFDIWIPIYDESSPVPFSPSGYRMSRHVDQEILSGVYIGMFDLINSKNAPSEVKIEVANMLRDLGCRHEPTGDDSDIFVTENCKQAVEVITGVRIRTAQFVKDDGYGGLRASITKGDCIARRLPGLPASDARLMITDRDGTPDIPNTAYQMENIKKILSTHHRLTVNDQSRGIALDQKVAVAFGGSSELAKLEAKQIFGLGHWEHKGVMGDAYFYLPSDL